MEIRFSDNNDIVDDDDLKPCVQFQNALPEVTQWEPAQKRRQCRPCLGHWPSKQVNFLLDVIARLLDNVTIF